MRNKCILAYGEVLWDLLPDNGAVLGGAPFNFIDRINELGDIGIIVSRIGKDKLGKRALKQIKKLGVSTDYIQTDSVYPTGTVDVQLDDDLNPSYEITKEVAFDNIIWEDNILAIVHNADCLYFGTLSQRSCQSKETLLQIVRLFEGKHIICDINLRKNCYSKQTIVESLKYANIVKFNNDEFNTTAKLLGLTGKTDEAKLKEIIETYQLKYGLVTFGEGGVLAASFKNEILYLPSYKIDITDPLGAGDAFIAGFIHKIINGYSLLESCDFANLLGGIVAGQRGATYPIGHSLIERSKNLRTNSPMNNFMSLIEDIST